MLSAIDYLTSVYIIQDITYGFQDNKILLPNIGKLSISS